MNVRNCKKCGRIFNYVIGPVICPRCKEGLEAKFQEVKEYVREHHGADISEVSEECQVEKSQIRQWIREERLQFSDDSPIRIPCESCGAMIQSGRFCDKCKLQMTNDFKQTVEQSKPKVSAAPKRKADGENKMRFLK
ncbi:MAG: flagellar protein [Clostridium sp.]|nr:flagellar protein [Clostridium sp.]